MANLCHWVAAKGTKTAVGMVPAERVTLGTKVELNSVLRPSASSAQSSGTPSTSRSVKKVPVGPGKIPSSASRAVNPA